MADRSRDIDTLSLREIMRAWPSTIRVCIDWRLHCVGCPIAGFHRLADAADEHGYDRDALRAALLLAIEARPVPPLPARDRRRPSAGDADV